MKTVIKWILWKLFNKRRIIKLIIQCRSGIHIDGETYNGSRVSIKNNKIFIDDYYYGDLK